MPEGETLIAPAPGEALVVEKRLGVREELRTTRRRTEGRRPQRVGLPGEEVSVVRADAARPDAGEDEVGGRRSPAAPRD